MSFEYSIFRMINNIQYLPLYDKDGNLIAMSISQEDHDVIQWDKETVPVCDDEGLRSTDVQRWWPWGTASEHSEHGSEDHPSGVRGGGGSEGQPQPSAEQEVSVEEDGGTPEV